MNKYIASLKLNFDPFVPSAESTEFFSAGNRQGLLEQLFEAAVYSDSIIAVTGGLGSGKTTMATRFGQSFGEEAICIPITSTLFMNEAQLLEAIVEHLPSDANFSEGEVTTEQLCQFAAQLDMDARSMVLIVDDAHELGSEVMAAIMVIVAQSPKSSIHVVLFGENQLLNMLYSALPEEKRHEMVNFELQELGSEDVGEYIRFKLKSAGHEGEIPLAGGTIGNIVNAAQGLPGAINSLVAEALSNELIVVKPAPEETEPEKNHKRYWIGASAVIAVLIIGVVALNIGRGESESSEAAVFTTAEAQPQIQIPVLASTAGQSDSPAAEPENQAEETSAEEALAEETPAVEAPPVEDNETAELAQAEIDPTENTLLPSEEPVPSSEAVVENSTAAEIGVELVGQDEPEPEPELEPEPEIPVDTAEDSIALASQIDGEIEESPLDRITDFEKALLAFAADSFTIQVLGARSEAGVQSFVEAQPATHAAKYFETRFEDRPWFVVVFGNFSSRDDAQRSIDSLPAELKAGAPWIRTMVAVQNAIRRLASAAAAEN